MFGYRFLRSAAVALWLYGLLGLVITAGMLVVGLSMFDRVTAVQRTFETSRGAVVQSVRGMSATLRDTASATSDFQRSIDIARSSADEASRLANDSAGTFRMLGGTLNSLTFLGIQPMAGLQPQFDNSADQLQQLAISLGTTREALALNATDVGRVGTDLTSLQSQLDTLAVSLAQPGVLGFDATSLFPLQIAFYAICAMILVQSGFSILGGVVLYRLQRHLGGRPLLPALERRNVVEAEQLETKERLSLVP